MLLSMIGAAHARLSVCPTREVFDCQPGTIPFEAKLQSDHLTLPLIRLFRSGLRHRVASSSPRQGGRQRLPESGVLTSIARTRLQKQSSWQWLLSMLTFCAVITSSEAVHGWYRFFVVVACYAWILGCMRFSRRFIDTPAISSLTELHLY